MIRAPGQRLVGQRRPGLPDVLADRQADGHAVDLDRRPARAGLEVAQLVEDAVVGQVQLAVDRLHRAVGEHGGGVVDVVGPLGVADDRDDPLDAGGDPLQRGARVGEEVLLEQQVLGRVAGERQLGEDDELRARRARRGDLAGDLRLVAGDVADDGVDLRERDRAAGRSSRRGPGPSQYSMNVRRAGSSGAFASRRCVAVTAATARAGSSRCCTITACPAATSAGVGRAADVARPARAGRCVSRSSL